MKEAVLPQNKFAEMSKLQPCFIDELTPSLKNLKTGSAWKKKKWFYLVKIIHYTVPSKPNILELKWLVNRMMACTDRVME